jgi:hypothetical protein
MAWSPNDAQPPSHARVHARPSEHARSLCGLAAGIGGWSRKRKDVNCALCQVEIGKRLMYPDRRSQDDRRTPKR